MPNQARRSYGNSFVFNEEGALFDGPKYIFGRIGRPQPRVVVFGQLGSEFLWRPRPGNDGLSLKKIFKNTPPNSDSEGVPFSSAMPPVRTVWGYPLPPRYIGIKGLGENRPQNLGAQSVTGKILVTKNLALASSSSARRCRVAMIRQFGDCAQGQMSQGVVDFCVWRPCGTRSDLFDSAPPLRGLIFRPSGLVVFSFLHPRLAAWAGHSCAASRLEGKVDHRG